MENARYNTQSRYRSHSLSAAWMFTMGMENGCTFLGWIILEQNKTKQKRPHYYQNRKRSTLLYHATKGGMLCYLPEPSTLQIVHCCLQRRIQHLSRKKRARSRKPRIAYLGRWRNVHVRLRYFEHPLKRYYALIEVYNLDAILIPIYFYRHPIKILYEKMLLPVTSTTSRSTFHS